MSKFSKKTEVRKPKSWHPGWLLGSFVGFAAVAVASLFVFDPTIIERGDLQSSRESPESPVDPGRVEEQTFSAVVQPRIVSKQDASDLEVSNGLDPVDYGHPVLADDLNSLVEDRPKGIAAMFEYARLVNALQSEPDAEGRVLKVEIYNTDFKYPLIRVAERWDSKNNMTGRSAMVADHLMVKWSPEATSDQIQSFMSENQFVIRDFDMDSHIMLVEFDGNDPRSMGRTLKMFNQSDLVEMAAPDYLATNNPDALK